MLKRLTLLALIAAGVAVGQITQSPVAGGGGGGDASEATLATRLGEATYTGRTGEVQASPTAYTVLGRLKAIEDALASLLTELQGKTEPANSQTVSGTVTATGPLTDTELRATPVPVSGTFYQATQPVSASSLPLPTGAATAAKQPALGTAGTASADVLTVQGIASMTALKVDGSAVTQPVSGTVTATGPITDTQLRATPVPVSGTFYQATQPVSASSLPLPTGASTLSEQQTQTTSLQLLDDAVATTASAITAKGLAASGTDGTNARVLKTDTSGELQVDVLTLPTVTANATLSAETTKVIGTVNISSGQTVGLAAGTNGIGKLTANSGVTIGAVELAASQSVAVTQATSSSLKAQVDPLTAASWGVGATAATAPANAGYVGVIGKNTQPTAVTDGQMAGLVASLDGVPYFRMGGPVLWTCSLNAIAASLTQCQAAPGAGLSLYVTGLYVQTTTTTSGTYALQTGTGTNCGTGTAAFFPSSSTSNRFNAPTTSNAMAAIQFPVPLKVAANTALCLIGVGTNTISAQIVGFTAP